MTPKAAQKLLVNIESALAKLRQTATKELRDALAVDENDDEGLQALEQAERQVLSTLYIPCGPTKLAYPEFEALLGKVRENLESLGASRAARVGEEDVAVLTQLGSLLEERPPVEERGWYEADVGEMPLRSVEWLQQLMSQLQVSLKLPNYLATVRIAHLEMRAQPYQAKQGLMSKMTVRFHAYLHGRQGDTVADLLTRGCVRLVLPGSGPLELPLKNVEAVEAPVEYMAA